LFFYTTITRAKALEPSDFGTSWTSHPYHLVERWFISREIPGAKRDLLNGDRVYRVHKQDVVRLDLDNLERRYIQNRTGTYYFDTIDPTSGKAMKDDVWLPVGP